MAQAQEGKNTEKKMKQDQRQLHKCYVSPHLPLQWQVYDSTIYQTSVLLVNKLAFL